MKDGKSVLVVLALGIFVVYVMRNLLGRVSAFFIVPMDNLLFISHRIPPVLMWMIFGLLVGLVYGSFVAIKKYKLDYKQLIAPVVALIILINLILLSSYFFKSESSVDDKGGETKSSPPEFYDALRNGIKAVEQEEYKAATGYFRKASEIDRQNTALDSLAGIYDAVAEEKCRLYRRNSNLKYIPNYYYKYAAALTGKTPQICK